MKILYLKPENGRPFFYADPAEVATAPAARSTGLRGWAERKWKGVEAAWKESNGTTARLTRRLWDWLHTFCRPDEPLLVKLATTESIEIRHPASMPEKKVQAAWKRYLARRARAHSFWLIVDGLLAPVTGVGFWLVPGPNVVGYWFGYRAYSHYTIFRAVHRARWRPPSTYFHADEALDEPIQRAPDGHGYIHDAVETPENLRVYLERKPADDADADQDPDFDESLDSPTTQATIRE